MKNALRVLIGGDEKRGVRKKNAKIKDCGGKCK